MILKRFILGFGIILLATACYEFKKPDKPKNLISKDKMVDILIDVKLLSSVNNKNRKVLKDSGINRNTYVFEKHHIDSLQFALSNDYYAFHLKEYQEIYEKVKDSLDALMKVKVLDSIKNIKIQDSLELIMKKDTLTEILLKKKFEDEGQLISPVSSTDSLSE